MTNKTHILIVFSTLFTLCGLILVWALANGDSAYHLMDILNYFMGQADETSQMIIGQIRMPRILVAILAGGSLGLSGSLLQTFTKNPLADSSTLGINAGAGVIIALAISHLDISSPAFITYLPFIATLGGLVSIYLTFMMAHKKGQSVSPVKVILSGVCLSSILSSSMISITGKVNQAKLSYVVNWLSGRITGDNWESLVLVLPCLLILWGLAYRRAYFLNILHLNEQTSLALGLDVKKERIILLLISSSLVAFSLSIAGNISFIGMLASHISKKFLPNDHRLTLPASMLIGMMILLVADTITRTWLVGSNIPTGILVSLIGAPYFLYLLYRTQK